MVYDMAQKILVVDDEEGIVLLLKDYFELQGYEVITAGGGMEALDRIRCGPDMRIYENVRGYDASGDSSIVAEHVRRIRNKIAEYTDQEVIRTVWGVGYQWIGSTKR